MSISKTPKIAKNAIDLVSRVNPKYHFPKDLKYLEKEIRMCLGLPFKGRTGGQVPYGYTYIKETDTNEPEQEIFKLLWESKRYLYTSSLREVTTWLNFKAEKLGFPRKISHMGLYEIMVIHPPFEECLLPKEEKEKILESLCQWNLKNQD